MMTSVNHGSHFHRYSTSSCVARVRDATRRDARSDAASTPKDAGGWLARSNRAKSSCTVACRARAHTIRLATPRGHLVRLHLTNVETAKKKYLIDA